MSASLSDGGEGSANFLKSSWTGKEVGLNSLKSDLQAASFSCVLRLCVSCIWRVRPQVDLQLRLQMGQGNMMVNVDGRSLRGVIYADYVE